MLETLHLTAAVCTILLTMTFDTCDGIPLDDPLKRKSEPLHQRIAKRTWPLTPDDQAAICALDEYYDAQVKACSRCSEICRPNIDLTICINNCREFYHVHFGSTGRPDTFQHPTYVITVPVTSDGASDELVRKPLFWTSVFSMAIAVAATVAIIVLCVRRKKQQQRLGQSSVRSRNSSGTASRNADVSVRSNRRDDAQPDQRILLAPGGSSKGVPPPLCWNGDPGACPNGIADCSRTLNMTENFGDRWNTGCCENTPKDLPTTPTSEKCPVQLSEPRRVVMKTAAWSHQLPCLNPGSDCSPLVPSIHHSKRGAIFPSTSSCADDDETVAKTHRSRQPSNCTRYTNTSSPSPPSLSPLTSRCSTNCSLKSKQLMDLLPVNENETKLKGCRQNAPVQRHPLPEVKDLKPEDMGISVIRQETVDDINRLQVIVRPMTTSADPDGQPATICSDAGFVSVITTL